VPSPRFVSWLVVFASLSFAAAPELLPATPVGAAPPQAVTDKLTQLLRTAVQAKSAGPTTPAPGAVLAEDARAKYFDLDFKAAAQLARQSVTRSLEHPEEFGDGSGYVLAHVLEALALRELKDTTGAIASFRAALAVKPDLSLSENDYSPDAIAALARAREDLASRPVSGDVNVSSAPPFARLFIDGRAQGETPTTVKGLPPGRHLVELFRDGRLAHREWLETGPATKDLQVALLEDPAAALRARLATAVTSGGSEREVLGAAQALARQLGLDVVLVAVGARAGRVVLIAARVTEAGVSRRVLTSIDENLLEASAAVRLVATAVLEAPALEPVSVGSPAETDFPKAWLGLAPPPAPLPAAPPPPSVTSKAWFWVLVGVGVVGAGVGTAYGVLAPRSLGVTVELPQ
jgi:hypothetical protein